MPGFLDAPATWEEKFKSMDWTNRDQMVTLFPEYVQEQYQHKKENRKNVSKTVHIESFTMKTPFGDQELLKSTELILEAGKRQGLYGVNCSGKTLLFSNISGGKIKDFPKHIHVHHCKELESHELSKSLLDTVVQSHEYRNALVRCEAKLRELLAADPAPTGETKDKLQENLDYIVFAMTQLRGYDAEERATKMLRVLGFDDIGIKKPVSDLSGGLRMRVALCMAFFIDADLLLLDEPTNHLDFPSVLWLENRLRGYRGAFVLVSHDRELLNNVCTAVMLLEDKQIKYYAMGFKDFEKTKEKEDKKKYDEIEKFLQKNPNADPSTLLGKQKKEKQEWSQNYHAKQVALAGKFTFPTATPLENKEMGADGQLVKPEDISLINLQNVRFSYNPKVEHPIFIFNTPISFNVTASTRVGVMGPNGAGKSTFLKLLTHKLTPTEGSVTWHPKFTLAYFGQHSTAELDLEQTPAEWMGQQFPDENAGGLRQHLAKTGIVGTVQDTRMQRLSFSQRSCVIFSKLTYVCPHLLIMDEPTNFLDLESVDSLISACNKYKGALLLVSHNRDFLRKCAKQYLSIVPGKFELYNSMKEAENATYSFIADMEDGGSVKGNAMDLSKSGGSVHASQRTDGGGQVEEKKSDRGADGIFTISSDPSTTTVKKVVAKPVTYEVGEKCQALWTDGKYYDVVIGKIDKGKYTIKYTAYGNTAVVEAKALKKAAPAAAKPGAKPAAAAAPKKK